MQLLYQSGWIYSTDVTMGNVYNSYQVKSQYSTAYHYIRSPLAEGKYIQKPSCVWLCGVWYIMTQFDTLGQMSEEQLQHDCNSDSSRGYQYISVDLGPSIPSINISRSYKHQSRPMDHGIPCITNSLWHRILSEWPHSHYSATSNMRCSYIANGKMSRKVAQTWQSIWEYSDKMRSRTTINSWVRQRGCCSAKLLYAFQFSNKINTVEANTNGSIIWWKVHHDLLLVENLENLSSVMPNSAHVIILCQDTLQRVWCIVDASLPFTHMQLALSCEDNQYLPN